MTHRTFGPAFVLGLGLGGFVDGILLHQILGWHHLLSATDASFDANLVADGLFHAGTWVATLIGVVWLWRRAREHTLDFRWRVLVGGLLAGWGAFNLVEGLVNHHLLGLHHVRFGMHQTWYDVGFLLLGALLVGVGLPLARRRSAADASAPRDRVR